MDPNQSIYTKILIYKCYLIFLWPIYKNIYFKTYFLPFGQKFNAQSLNPGFSYSMDPNQSIYTKISNYTCYLTFLWPIYKSIYFKKYFLPLGQKLNAQSLNLIIFIQYGPKLANMHKFINIHMLSNLFWPIYKNIYFKKYFFPLGQKLNAQSLNPEFSYSMDPNQSIYTKISNYTCYLTFL